MMGRRREERREEREVFGRGGSANRYRMREKLVSFGNDFWIENEQGQRAFKVDGKMLRVRDTMTIEGPNGGTLATLRKELIAPLRDRWTVKIGNGPDLNIQGNILNFEYEIGEGRTKVAQVSKKWFRIADTYGVQIEPSQNDVVILAITVAIDMMR